MLLWPQFPALYENLNPISVLKNNLLNHCPSVFTRSHPVFLWISLGRWEKGGNLILTLTGLPFGLNKRKISNYPIDNYSLHISPLAQTSAQQQKTATHQGCTHANHYPLGDRLACDCPCWLRKESWTPPHRQARGRLPLPAATLSPGSSQTPGWTETMWEYDSLTVRGPKWKTELYTCYRSRPDQVKR